MSADSHLYPTDDEMGLVGACLLGGVDTAIEVCAQVPVNAIFHDGLREVRADAG